MTREEQATMAAIQRMARTLVDMERSLALIAESLIEAMSALSAVIATTVESDKLQSTGRDEPGQTEGGHDEGR